MLQEFLLKNPDLSEKKRFTEGVKLFRNKIICSISIGSWKPKTKGLGSALVSWFSQATCLWSSLAAVKQSWEPGPPAQGTSWDSDLQDASVAGLSWNCSP